jgi:hypothetical protein
MKYKWQYLEGSNLANTPNSFYIGTSPRQLQHCNAPMAVQNMLATTGIPDGEVDLFSEPCTVLVGGSHACTEVLYGHLHQSHVLLCISKKCWIKNAA